MKRIRYKCEACGAVTKEWFKMNATPPDRMRCRTCGKWMAARPPRAAIHFHPTRRQR